MFFELIGTLLAGAAAALLFWAINRTLKGRLPNWLMPVTAGAAMLVATISSEYGWFDRTRANMPEGLVVAQTVEEKVFYRPWTYLRPYTTRFVALNTASTRTNPAYPDQRMADLVFYGRWARTTQVPVLFDCAAYARANLIDGVEFAADGAVSNAAWQQVGADDPVLQTACGAL